MRTEENVLKIQWVFLISAILWSLKAYIQSLVWPGLSKVWSNNGSETVIKTCYIQTYMRGNTDTKQAIFSDLSNTFLEK